MKPFFALVIASLCLTACGDGAVPLPKPRSYPKVDFPERAYENVTTEYCSFSFDKPATASIVREDLFFDRVPPDSCWFDLQLDPGLNGSIHFSYYPLEGYDDFERLRDEAFELVGVHNERASDIEEVIFHRDVADVHGIAFDIAGPAASPFQFFLTDSTNHFLRGALYYNAAVQPDSLRPIIDYTKEDIIRLMETLEWAK